MNLPGFSATAGLEWNRSAGAPRRRTRPSADDSLVRPAMRCNASGDWNWCCANSSYCCLWNGDSYYGCGWREP